MAVSLLHQARQLKHRIFVALKRAKVPIEECRRALFDRRYAIRERRRPFVYEPAFFEATFLARASPRVLGLPAPAPAILWVIWLGDLPSERRRRSLASLTEQRGIDVRVVTDPQSVLVPGHPFHRAFERLHAVHRSDYLRAYLMHHYGGAYLDVKPMPRQVAPVIESLNARPDAWMAGYREVTSQYVPDLPHALGSILKRHYRAVLGTSGFACKPASTFTAEWLRELDARLDYYEGALTEVEGRNADPFAPPYGYPIRWTEILGDITQPLCLKHQTHLLFFDSIRPILQDYRS